MKKYALGKEDIAFFVVSIFLVGLIIGLTISFQSEPQKRLLASEKIVRMGIPAVDSDGKGVVGTLTTTIRPGSGQVLVNVNSVLAQFDTQISGRTAAKAAASALKTDLSGLDIIYDIDINASVIEGPSAGSSMATSIALAFTGARAADNIMMTGTIHEDGSIGPVGSVLEKATAAKAAGADIFLVPEGQSSELRSSRARSCKDAGGMRVCTIDYDYSEVNIGSSLNITVAEARNVNEALEFFRNSTKSGSASLIQK